MGTNEKCWIIKSNKNKFVSATSYNTQGVLKFSWSLDPSEAKIYTEYPVDCPSNSRVFAVYPDQFFKIEIDESQPKIVKSDLKPFFAKDEFRFKEDAIKNFILCNTQTIEKLKKRIKELEDYREFCNKLLTENKTTDLEKENPKFESFKSKCQNKVLSFTISLWGTKYVDILGKTITEENTVVFCDSYGTKVLEIEKSSVVDFFHVEAEIYTVHVKPRHEQTFALDFQLL